MTVEWVGSAIKLGRTTGTFFCLAPNKEGVPRSDKPIAGRIIRQLK